MKLESKQNKIPEECIEILKAMQVSLEKLVKERDDEIDTAMEEFTEKKFIKVSSLKKKYALKIKMAEKQGSAAKVSKDDLQGQMKDEMKRVDKECAEESASIKLNIK